MMTTTATVTQEYAIYTLTDPSTSRVRYVGLTKNPEQRLKQHLRKAPYWIEEILSQGLQPILEIVERTGTLEEAQAAEKRWIYHYEGQGHALENLVHNEAAHRERYERESLYNGIYKKFAQSFSREDAEKLTSMTIAGYDTVGFCAWDMRYDTVLDTIHLLEKRPGFGLHLNEFDAIELTFNLFGYTWKGESEAGK